MERITFERQPWGKHEWQINNPNRLMREVLEELLERGENDGRFMERKGEAMLGAQRHPLNQGFWGLRLPWQAAGGEGPAGRSPVLRRRSGTMWRVPGRA